MRANRRWIFWAPLLAVVGCGDAGPGYESDHHTAIEQPLNSLTAELNVGLMTGDADGNIASRTVSKGTLNGNQVCFTPAPQNNVIQYIVTDSCGAADTCETNIFVIVNRPPQANVS